MFQLASPFERLRDLIGDAAPGAEPIDLSVGNPTHAPPAFVAEVIARHSETLTAYPPIAGVPALQRALHDYCDRRFGLNGFLREHGAVLPLSGSREGLFLAAITARDLIAKPLPTVLFANPFYQAYPGACHAIGAKAVPVSAGTDGLPDLAAVPESDLERAVAFYVGSPANPSGAVLSVANWHDLFDLAERHNFILFADECYADLYRGAHGPPPGALTAARERPDALSRLFAFNSLSKRSNLAGMRAGYVAGAAQPMAVMRQYRNQVGPQVPTVLQHAAAAAYDDEAHVVENRRLYDEKFAAAAERLGPVFGDVVPPAGFFLWLDVGGDDVAATRALWAEQGVKAVPGSYLALTDSADKNPGRGFIRLALVADATVTREALTRVSTVFGGQTSERIATEGVGSGP